VFDSGFAQDIVLYGEERSAAAPDDGEADASAATGGAGAGRPMHTGRD
jgi:hypothetical protein